MEQCSGGYDVALADLQRLHRGVICEDLLELKGTSDASGLCSEFHYLLAINIENAILLINAACD